jgi:hypothetical protein
MPIGLIFWVIMLLWILSWVASSWGAQQFPWAIHASGLLFFILLFLLGWHDFGFIVHP